MASGEKPTTADLGTALLAWYGEALAQFPDGLVSQSQAASMLGIGRMAVNRLVARGYLQAVYFPRMPKVAGFSGEDSEDWVWQRILTWFRGWAEKSRFPKACFVSFADVVELWLRGDARKKCKLSWLETISKYRSKDEAVRQIHDDRDTAADLEATNYQFEKCNFDSDGSRRGRLASMRVFMHDSMLAWFEEQGAKAGIPRNQLIFWALQEWKQQIESRESGKVELARLPNEDEAERIMQSIKGACMQRYRAAGESLFTNMIDEFGGNLGMVNGVGVSLDGKVD